MRKLRRYCHARTIKSGENRRDTGRKFWRKNKWSRPKERWLDEVQDDMIKIGVRRWRTKSNTQRRIEDKM